jgi:hypothetical protein
LYYAALLPSLFSNQYWFETPSIAAFKHCGFEYFGILMPTPLSQLLFSFNIKFPSMNDEQHFVKNQHSKAKASNNVVHMGAMQAQLANGCS